MTINTKAALIIAGAIFGSVFFYWYMSPFQQCYRFRMTVEGGNNSGPIPDPDWAYYKCQDFSR